MEAVLTAASVAIEDVHGCLVVGFADHDGRDYLLLQRANEDDDQDRSLGLDTYYVERSDQGRSCYGGIKRLTLDRRRIEIRFDEAAETAMGGSRCLIIEFEIDKGHFDKLVAGLTRVFESTDCLRVSPTAG